MLVHLRRSQKNAGSQGTPFWGQSTSSWCSMLDQVSRTHKLPRMQFTILKPHKVPSAAGINLVSHLWPTRWHQSDLQMSWKERRSWWGGGWDNKNENAQNFCAQYYILRWPNWGLIWEVGASGAGRRRATRVMFQQWFHAAQIFTCAC